VPIGNETFALSCAFTVLLLPAALADVRTPKICFLVEQQSVVSLFIGKMFAARFTGVRAGLDVPIVHRNRVLSR
jgi:hypothetical protein